MKIENVRQAPIAFDRLTELAEAMQAVAETPENEDVQGIICLNSENEAGIVMFGFDDVTEGIAALLMHIKAALQSEGKEFGVMTDQGFMVL